MAETLELTFGDASDDYDLDILTDADWQDWQDHLARDRTLDWSHELEELRTDPIYARAVA
jgi:hypothetical protein